MCKTEEWTSQKEIREIIYILILFSLYLKALNGMGSFRESASLGKSSSLRTELWAVDRGTGKEDWKGAATKVGGELTECGA